MVASNSIIPQTVRRFLILVTKKCRNYAACGVSQTPKYLMVQKVSILLEPQIHLLHGAEKLQWELFRQAIVVGVCCKIYNNQIRA